MVIPEPSSEQFFGIDGVGARIFELLTTLHRFSDVVDILLSEYDVDREVLEDDVRRFVEDLAAAKLLRTATD